MKRTIILLMTVMALVLAACGSDQTDATSTPASTPALTPTPTEEATPEPTESEPAETPEATDGQTGSVIEGELSELLPDEVGGLAREDLPPQMEQIMGQAVAGAGGAAEDAEIAWGLYGEGDLMVIAMRMPDVSSTDLEALARAFASVSPTGAAGEQFDTEQATVGGKDVLKMTAEAEGGESGTVFVYTVDDAFFTVVAQDEGLAEELLSQLP